jgi:hypothetical protein
LRCPSIFDSAIARICRAADEHRRHLEDDVMLWVRRTNDCVRLRLARRLDPTHLHAQLGGHLAARSSSACTNVDFRLRADVHACANLNDADTCSLLLWSKRHSMMRIFADVNWLWLVEIARSCPRDVTSRFITWAMTHDDVDAAV